MVQVVAYEEFKALKRLVEEVREENQFIISLLTGERWLSREQAMKALNCRDDKLRQLTIDNVLTYRYEGKKPYYDAFRIRDYLLAQKIESKEADRRILKARFDLE